MQEEQRETFGSAWGVVLATAGVAIGLGNIWRFPYMMGAFGGVGFLAIYLAVVFLFGVPALMCEWALGRHTRRGPMGGFSKAGFPAGAWWGRLLLLTIIMASSYYVVVLGWVLHYLALFATSRVEGDSAALFNDFTANLGLQFPFVWACIALGCFALLFGVKRGIERISRWITPLFFLLFALLIVRILSLEGAWAGFLDYLFDSRDQFTAKTVLAAMGQGLFSLSLGGTFMVIYGSYLRREENIPRGAFWTATLDAAAAMMATLVVLPAVLYFQIELNSGPGLLFVVMPRVFQGLPAGSLLGAAFFLSVLLVAMLSLIGAYEVMVGAAQDIWGWSRRKALAWILISQTVLIFPPMLSVGYVFYSDLIWGSTLQPFGAALAVLAVTWSLGRARALEEIGRGSSLRISGLLYYWMKYVIPLGILSGLIYGWTGA